MLGLTYPGLFTFGDFFQFDGSFPYPVKFYISKSDFFQAIIIRIGNRQV